MRGFFRIKMKPHRHEYHNLKVNAAKCMSIQKSNKRKYLSLAKTEVSF